ncbi:hypothetical protein BKA93DRAFT_754420 [Sparassis latifolia]
MVSCTAPVTPMFLPPVVILPFVPNTASVGRVAEVQSASLPYRAEAERFLPKSPSVHDLAHFISDWFNRVDINLDILVVTGNGVTSIKRQVTHDGCGELEEPLTRNVIWASKLMEKSSKTGIKQARDSSQPLYSLTRDLQAAEFKTSFNAMTHFGDGNREYWPI